MSLLTEADLNPDPIAQFDRWYDEARTASGLEAAEAACLSTIDPTGFPDGRMVLLKAFDVRGFVFYTNMHSVKGRSLAKVPKAALTFYWSAQERQVRLQGHITPVASAEADAYFKTRARLSQIGAWASDQSAPLPDRAALDRAIDALQKKYEGKEIPRPPHWSGYRLEPIKFEFWQARPNRLHDRFLYTRDGSRWELQRLYP